MNTYYTASVKTVLINYLSAMLLLTIGYLFYTSHPSFKNFFSSTYNFRLFTITDEQVLFGTLTCYAIGLIPFYFTFSDGYRTKSRLVVQTVLHLNRISLQKDDKTAILSTIMKFLFLPLMIVWLTGHLATLITQGVMFFRDNDFFPNGYWFVFQTVLFVDVLFFALGCALEHPKLGNEIRSVDDTLLGWIVVLLCYPPINGVTNQIFGWNSSDYPKFHSELLQYIAGFAMLFFLSIYSWSSVAMNIRASNLTNRGIVTKGPYRWVRHPAYTAKNIAWWIGALPVLADKWQQSQVAFIFAFLGTTGWAFVYYIRAITEERHLSKDPDYLNYCQSVKFRFIPGVQ